MTWQENAFNRQPATKAENTELKETDPATLMLLEKKAREIANTAAPQEQFTDAEIHQMAVILALHAESKGEPLDEDIVSDLSFESRIIDALDARNKMRGESKGYIAGAEGTVIGAATTSAEAQKMTESEREAS
jgi:hypothetical protein